ncbi:MAG: hypothetical protein LQ340_007786, partial [Diploschistes diacapsis]
MNPVMRRMLLVCDAHVDLFSQDSDGMTILHYLSWSSQTSPSELQRLLKGDTTSLLVHDSLGRSVLHFAAERGNKGLLLYLISLGIGGCCNLIDSNGATLLHYAMESKRVETIELVRGLASDIRAKDYRGRSILHYACWRGNTAAVQRVVELGGADLLYEADARGKTPLQFAETAGAASILELAKTLGTTRAPDPVTCQQESAVSPSSNVKKDYFVRTATPDPLDPPNRDLRYALFTP